MQTSQIRTSIASDFFFFRQLFFPQKWSSSTTDFNFCSTKIHVNAEESHPWSFSVHCNQCREMSSPLTATETLSISAHFHYKIIAETSSVNDNHCRHYQFTTTIAETLLVHYNHCWNIVCPQQSLQKHHLVSYNHCRHASPLNWFTNEPMLSRWIYPLIRWPRSINYFQLYF